MKFNFLKFKQQKANVDARCDHDSLYQAIEAIMKNIRQQLTREPFSHIVRTSKEYSDVQQAHNDAFLLDGAIERLAAINLGGGNS